MQQYQQGLMPQAPRQEGQLVKFYKSGIFGFSSAPGRLQRDQGDMARQGYRLIFAAYLGTNLFWRRIIVTIWTR